MWVAESDAQTRGIYKALFVLGCRAPNSAEFVLGVKRISAMSRAGAMRLNIPAKQLPVVGRAVSNRSTIHRTAVTADT